MARMTRWTAFALLGVVAAITLVIVAVLNWIQADRAELVDRFGDERLVQLDQAVAEVEEDLADIADDLRFAGHLVQAADSATDREREIGGLLAVVKHYRLVQVFDREARRLLSVPDPLAAASFAPAAFDADMARVALAAMRRPGDAIETSPALAADPSGWYRVFAAALPDGSGAIVVLVDTQPLFAKLRLVLSSPGARLVLIGAHGRPAPATDSAVAQEIIRAPVDSPLGGLVAAMRAGQRGVRPLPASPDGRGAMVDSIAAFAPIDIRGGAHWTAATITPTAELRDHERAVMLRLGLGSGAVILCLLGFAAYVVVSSRRVVAVRERLRSAEHLAHLHEKTEKILDNVPAGVMVLSSDGRITAANRGLRVHIPPDALGRPIDAAFPDAPSAVVARLHGLIERARSTERVQSLFGERLALFGEEGQYSVHAVPLEPRFDEARALLVIDDVSEVQSLESQLVRAEKLATVGVLAAGIAHEIGTPLGVVRARAEYLAGKLGADSSLAAGAQVIVDQIDRVARTIRQLLDFSRVKPASVQPVALTGAAYAAVDLLRFEAERAAVTVEVDIPSGLDVLADPDQLQQVLVNLLLNACDACDRDGHVRIRARSDGGEPGSVRIEVSDDGCGVPPELRLRVFDPFFTTKKRGKGTGLGLSIAAQLVRNHGGQIDLDSEAGRGTTVLMSWPAVPAAAGEELHERLGG